MGKQIEEMLKLDIEQSINGYSAFINNMRISKAKPLSVSKTVISLDCPKKYIYEAIGIHKNAVVLTGMETEQQFEDLMVAFDEMGFMPNTTHPFPEEYVETWKQRLIFVFGQLRKETAEKFAERVKMAFYYEFDELIPSIMADKIDEIVKEITEGKANASKTKF